MGTPIKDLKASLKKLREQLDFIWKKHHGDRVDPKIEKIRNILNSINPQKKIDQTQIYNLLDLSNKIIEVRFENRSHKILGNLIVPPYDLWMPFKAIGKDPEKILPTETAEINIKEKLEEAERELEADKSKSKRK
jgi:hypothetical protein